MKIALIGVVELPVKQDACGGTEIWTYEFAEKLAAAGHEVTLFGNNESSFSGKSIATCGQEDVLDKSSGLPHPLKNTLFSVDEMIEIVNKQDDFDIIHLSVSNPFFCIPFSKLIKKPFVITLHSALLGYDDMGSVFKNFPKPHYVFVSQNLADRWPKPKSFSVIDNGINIDNFPFNPTSKGYLFWMGRMMDKKGPEDAITVAEKLGENLVLAGPMRDQAYFDEKIKPHLSSRIEYVGELGLGKKVEYYRGAKVFLFPTKYEEASGLVIPEANACGTPVIAYDRGAIKEMIDSGVNGFVVPADDIGAMIEAVKKVSVINREDCRRVAMKNRSIDTMISEYIGCYGELLNNGRMNAKD